MEDKRVTAHLIPYKINNGIFSFFLQKRSDDAERHAGGLSIFGGGVEGDETPEQAMLRESKEELNFVPHNYFYLGEYGDDYSISHYYAVAVSADFAANLKIGEGERGQFFSEAEMQNEPTLSENSKKILSDLIARKHR